MDLKDYYKAFSTQPFPDGEYASLAVIAALEARCKELESALNNIDDLMIADKRYVASGWHFKVCELLVTPITTEHLNNWYQGMLGEPVAWTNENDIEYMRGKDNAVSIRVWKFRDDIDNLPLYAPKKVQP